MSSMENLKHLMQTIDYRILLPIIARMPLVLGEYFSGLRGMFQAILDYDWRSMALRQRYVRKNSYQAMKIIMPEAGKSKWVSATLDRFMHYSREEWEACLFGKEVMSFIARNSFIEGMPELLKIQKQGRGLVLVSSHYGSFCMGMVLLGMNGLRTNVVNTSMIEDPRIHPDVRSFFNRKYRAMEHHMGGKMVYHETDRSFFYRALERGETVVLLVDTQGTKSTVVIPFLGMSFRMPLGAWHMAKKTGSLLGAFVCLRQAPGRYRVFCHPPQEIDSLSPKDAMVPLYTFLETWMRKAPEQWLAAEHLLNYEATPPPCLPH